MGKQSKDKKDRGVDGHSLFFFSFSLFLFFSFLSWEIMVC